LFGKSAKNARKTAFFRRIVRKKERKSLLQADFLGKHMFAFYVCGKKRANFFNFFRFFSA